MEFLVLITSAILINNILLAQYLGNCPFCGVSAKTDTAFGMGMAVIFVMVLASLITWITHYYVLVPLHLGYLQTMVFILVIAGLVQLVEGFLKKYIPALYRSMGIYLPLITTNCAVLGVAIINIRKGFDLLDTLVFSAASGIGFLLALLMMSGLRERYEISPIPKSLQGVAITLVTAGLLALAFFGFVGMDEALASLK